MIKFALETIFKIVINFMFFMFSYQITKFLVKKAVNEVLHVWKMRVDMTDTFTQEWFAQ